MLKTFTPIKNIFFQDHQSLREGEQFFLSGRFEKAIEKFDEFSKISTSSKKFVAGRIAITLMKLKRFDEATDFLKKSIEAQPDKELNYICLMAECLYGVGKIKETEKLCMDILSRYPDAEDAKNLLNKTSIHPHISIMCNGYNHTESTQSFQSLESIIQILNLDGDRDEAYHYAISLLNQSQNESIVPYLFLSDYYNEKQTYFECLPLLRKLENAIIDVDQKKLASKKLLSIYKLSPCYKYSKYYKNTNNVLEEFTLKLIKELEEKVKLLSLSEFKIKYLHVINLDNYFTEEPRLAMV